MIEGIGCGSAEAEAAGCSSVTSTTLRVFPAYWPTPDAVSRRLEISIALARISIWFTIPASDPVPGDAWDVDLINRYQHKFRKGALDESN